MLHIFSLNLHILHSGWSWLCCWPFAFAVSDSQSKQASSSDSIQSWSCSSCTPPETQLSGCVLHSGTHQIDLYHTCLLAWMSNIFRLCNVEIQTRGRCSLLCDLKMQLLFGLQKELSSWFKVSSLKIPQSRSRKTPRVQQQLQSFPVILFLLQTRCPQVVVFVALA